MIEHARRVPLRPIRWTDSEATAAIEDIVADGLEHLDAERFWPADLLDEGIRDGHTSFYFAATGVIWGIDYLGRVGATKARFDFRSILPRLMEANQAEITRSRGSLLFGDLGTALLVMRVGPTPAIADLVYARADANTTLPVRELMWGMPGSMIACCHMAAMTAEPRWRALFAIQAARLLRDLEETDDGPLWTQDLYGRHLRYLGPVHGYAGNMIALMRGWEWADGRSARADRGGRSADPDGERVAFRARYIMAWRCGRSPHTSRGPRQLQQRPRAALPALSRSSRDGDRIRGCAVHIC
jgi:hypothetical protein